MTTGEPSAFWKQLGTEHASELASRGAEDMKRRQALRYFTWKWQWRDLRRSDQMRFLLRHSSMADVVRAVWRPGPLDDDTWAGPEWTKLDRWLYTFATRLLWSYAERVGLPTLSLAEPTLGSPFPVHFEGRLISQDLANTALELDAVHRSGSDPPHHIIEIGAGYGRTAYALLSLNPLATYTVVDIEPALTLVPAVPRPNSSVPNACASWRRTGSTSWMVGSSISASPSHPCKRWFHNRWTPISCCSIGS